MNKILFATLCLIFTSCTKKEVSFNVQRECGAAITENTNLVNVFTILKLKGSDSQKVVSITCTKETGRCLGGELHIPKNDKNLSMLDLNAQVYEPEQIDIRKTISIIKYRNTTMTIDLEAKTVKMAIQFDNDNPPFTEYWEGSCE